MSTELDFAEMSDEELAKMDSVPGSALDLDDAPKDDTEETPEALAVDDTLEGAIDAAADAEAESESQEESQEEPEQAEEKTGSETEDPETPSETDDVSEDGHTTSKQTEPEQTPEAQAEPEAGADPEAQAEGESAGEGEGGEAEQQISVEDAYAKIMAPFKANGREFAPKDPEEVIRLMQMGAGYARKMQALKPNLRMMRMLENKGLLDEEKLNFLIDVNDRNPQAIQKLLQDSKIDPLDLDTSEPVQYKPNNHAVSEAEYSFQETVRELEDTDGGAETIQTVSQSWDSASKQAIFQDPKILSLIHEQRVNGIYGRITDELERQKMLGNYGDVPFIHAYKAIGDYLHERGELIPEATTEAAQPSTPAPTAQPRTMVETRIATPKATLANGDRVSATAPTRTTPAPAKKPFDPFSMSDEEIMGLELPKS